MVMKGRAGVLEVGDKGGSTCRKKGRRKDGNEQERQRGVLQKGMKARLEVKIRGKRSRGGRKEARGRGKEEKADLKRK